MLRQSGTAAVAVSATATVMAMAIAMGSLAGCQRGVLDKDAGSGFLGPVADGGAIGPGLPGGGAGSPATTGPHRLACDTALPGAADWTPVPAPAGLDGLVIEDAWAARGDDVFFVGKIPMLGDPPQALAEIVRWTRGCWNVEMTWQIPSDLKVSISGSTPNDVWAAMGNALFHGDGAGWFRADTEIQSLLNAQVAGRTVVASQVRVAGGAVWVTGATFIWQRGDGRWRMFELTTADVFGASGSQGTFAIDSLWAGGRDDAAVGGKIDVLGRIPDTAFVYRYDGTGWTLRGVSDGTVVSMWDDATGGLWIASQQGYLNPPLFRDTRQGTDGDVSTVSIDGWPVGADSARLWGRADDDVFVSGASTLAHWDGLAWTMMAAPPAADTDDVAIGTSAASTTWIAHRGPRVFRRDN